MRISTLAVVLRARRDAPDVRWRAGGFIVAMEVSDLPLGYLGQVETNDHPVTISVVLVRHIRVDGVVQPAGKDQHSSGDRREVHLRPSLLGRAAIGLVSRP